MRIRRPSPRTAGFAIATPIAIVGVILLFTTPSLVGQMTPVRGSSTFSLAGLPTQTAFNHQIDHIVVVMMENHAFDNYFGAYCAKVGPYCSYKVSGIPASTCVPKNPAYPAGPCVVPFPLGTHNYSIHQGLPHSVNSSLGSWNNGSMNGFFMAEHSGVYPFGHYGGTSAALIWDFAEEYGMGDDFFSNDLAPSLPNHWYLVAGTTPPEVQDHVFYTQQKAHAALRSIYLNQANNTTAISDMLSGSNITWRWYNHPIAKTYGAAINNLTWNGTGGSAFLLWNPLAAKAESYTSPMSSHFVNSSSFYSNAAKGTLPSVSFIIPPGIYSDHPPFSAAAAQDWEASIVDAVESSPDWNHTALFITYDEYGGFYDNVAPPLALGTTLRLGFRVPFLVISPFARQGYVSHSLDYTDSILRLIEDRFGLPCLTAVDCNAPSLLQYFHFNQTARPPIIFPTTLDNATYPMPLQNGLNLYSWAALHYQVPEQFIVYPDGPGLDVD